MVCNWTPIVDTTCYPEWAGYSPDDQAAATAWATEILWALSGRRFGACPLTVRPCISPVRWRSYETFPVLLDAPGGPVGPYLQDGAWFNACGCWGSCGCRYPTGTALDLPGPVASIDSVTVAGALVDPAAYRVDDGHLLVRQDGDRWPVCAGDCDIAVAAAAWQVAYQRGVPVPTGGKVAAGVMAAEYRRSLCGQDCKLPPRVQSVTRQGVEMTMIDTAEYLDKGRTGVTEVDQWLAAVNPSGLRQASSVYSLDLDEPVTTTWTAP
jgi:hypothetical protein